MALRIKDVNRVDEFLSIIDHLKKTKIEIGIFGEDDANILMIARVHEFGVDINVTQKMRGFFLAQGTPLSKGKNKISIPERSFIRSGYDKNLNKIVKVVENLLPKVFSFDLTVDQFYEQLGAYTVGFIQEYMTDLRDPPNAPLTLEKKKPKTNPLIDTGKLRESITYKVVRG